MQKSPNNLIVKDEDKEKLYQFLHYRFGIEREYLASFQYIKRGDSIWICSKDIDITFLKLVEFERVGLRCCRWTDDFFKPTSFFLQFLGNKVQKGFLELDNPQLINYLNRDDVEFQSEVESGYVAIKYDGYMVGCARFKENIIYSEFPKKIAHNMKIDQIRNRNL